MEYMFYLADITREGRFLLVEVSIFAGFFIFDRSELWAKGGENFNSVLDI